MFFNCITKHKAGEVTVNTENDGLSEVWLNQTLFQLIDVALLIHPIMKTAPHLGRGGQRSGEMNFGVFWCRYLTL